MVLDYRGHQYRPATVERAPGRVSGEVIGLAAVPAVRVMLVDGQDLVRGGFSMALSADPGIDVVAEARCGRSAAAQMHIVQPDVVITDLLVPEIEDGIDLMRAIRRSVTHERTRIIVLTGTCDNYALYRSLREGASGILLKSTSRDELTHTVKQVAHGFAVVCPEMTRCLLDNFEIRPTENYDDVTAAALHLLSRREMDVLLRLGGGRSNQEIAEELYLTTATVKTHVSNVLSKLNLRDRVQAALFAHDTCVLQSPVALDRRPELTLRARRSA